MCRIRRDGACFRISDGDGNEISIPALELRQLISDLLLALGVPPLPEATDLELAAPGANVPALMELGNEWRAPARRGRAAINRIYFDPLQGWWGLRIEPGRNAQFRGEPITELEARAIIARFNGSKLFFDINTSMFHGTNMDAEAFLFIVEKIRMLENKENESLNNA